MYAHLYTLTYDNYAEPMEVWFVRTNGTTIRPLGTIYSQEGTDPIPVSFRAMTPDHYFAGSTTNLIAAADILYDVDRAMTKTDPEDNTAFIAGVVAGADR
jgi:hypothetical protein